MATTTLFMVWLVGHFGRLAGDQDGLIRFVLGVLFAIVILLRPKPSDKPASPPGRRIVPVVMLTGTLLAVAGIVFTINQFEWLGLVLVLYACLRWSLPARYGPDILLAMLLLYWLHPLPGQVFSKLQLLMQKLSVKGAEWALHCLNVRIWADELVLRTGFRTFGVPESCSGMRTAVTVLLCTLGVAILFRLRWFETLFFLAAGLVQVLLLNVLRIVLMVWWAPRMPPEWGDTFLHDTLGIFLLIAIVLVQAEVSAWKLFWERRARIQAEIRQGKREARDRATMLPRFWERVVRFWWPVTAGLLFVALVALAFYKRRPEHRVAMIRDVIESLMETDLEAAEDGIMALLWLRPDDRDLLSKRAIVAVMRGRHEHALSQFDRLPGELSAYEKMMKSWALMALNRPEEAIALVESLPPSAKDQPGVAIVRAEYAARQGRPEEVSRNVVIAARSHRVIERVRALFPYLALHEQWQALADCSVNVPPFTELSHALLAVHANLKVNNMTAATELLKYVLEKWPNNPLYLGSLFSLAVRRPGGRWEDVFAENLKANIDALDTDVLAYYLSYCFQLNRPDLAWIAFLRLQELDPADPALPMAPARFGDVWFVFRRHQLGISAGNPDEKIDLRPFYQHTRHIAPFRSLWERIPLADVLTAGDFERQRSEYLKQCLAELNHREQEGRLTLRMEMAFPSVLAMIGRFEEAHARLDDIERRYPDMRDEVLLQHAVFFDQRGEWENSYEALVEYFDSVTHPNFTASLLMVNAMMNLNMGVAALDVAERAAKLFPGSEQLKLAIAAIWDVFGFKDQALFVLSGSPTETRSRALPQLLYDTGRYSEAEKVSRALGVQIRRRKGTDEQQGMAPLPAEFAVGRRLPPPLTAAEMAAAARALREQTRPVSSFIARLRELQRQWYEAGGSGSAADPAIWKQAGRNPTEQAVALHWLALMLARQNQDAAALRVAQQAVELLPQSAIMRRVLIMLKGGERGVVEEARRVCPDDPEIWLAWLVTKEREVGPGPWGGREIEAATVTTRFSVETICRAGDFMLRKGMLEAAAMAARDAVKRARGYIPAYVLGLRCAIEQRDSRWALACALSGAENAKDPRRFYQTVVAVKAAGKNIDKDLLTALEYLRETLPQEKIWAEQLGRVYFEKYDAERALAVLGPLIAEDVRGVRVHSLLLAAEAARQEGEMRRAIDILETAHAMYPEKVAILNNLVYNLAQNEQTLPRARELLPGLLALGGDSFVVLDTAAMVYLRSGQLATAREYMEKALNLLDEDDYTALEVNLNAAEVLFRSGEYENARRKLEEIRRNPAVPHLIDMNARRLLDQIRDAITSG